MSTLALRTRPAWDIDRWVRDFFGPATADDWFAGAFTPPRRSSGTATTRWCAWNCPASMSRRTSTSRSTAVTWSSTASVATSAPQEIRHTMPDTSARCGTGRSAGRSSCRPRHRRGHLGVVRRRCADGSGGRCPQGRRVPAHRDRKQVALTTPKPVEPPRFHRLSSSQPPGVSVVVSYVVSYVVS